jgi:hypothetical protein
LSNWLKETDKVAFDGAKFQPSDEAASMLVYPFEGDRADFPTGIAWKDGVWTTEISRKLVTGSKTDVHFDDLGVAYPFGVSVFDNAQVRHGYVQKPITLVFQK